MNEEKIRKQVLKLQDALISLEELDRTGKLNKINYKERSSFTIDSDVLREFRNYCKKHGLNMSALLEKFMKEKVKK
ncbi:MAG: hypothetical protein KKF46_04120 [Nanoarchaeota archaeon]|nr:hypothetical protein [Nanoarchaeota archaeon]